MIEVFVLANTIIVLLFGACSLGYGSYHKDASMVVMGILIIVFEGILFFGAIETLHQPTAMDVYQRKTELMYTVKGSEVVDSVVVFKGEEKD